MPDRPVCDFQTDMVEIIVMTTKNHTQQHFRAINNQPKGALPNYKTHLGMIHCGSVTNISQTQDIRWDMKNSDQEQMVCNIKGAGHPAHTLGFVQELISPSNLAILGRPQSLDKPK